MMQAWRRIWSTVADTAVRSNRITVLPMKRPAAHVHALPPNTAGQRIAVVIHTAVFVLAFIVFAFFD